MDGGGQAPGLGDIVEIRCRYCRLNLDATVAAMNADGSIAKVQCRTCRHFQDYKPPIPPEQARARQMQRVMRLAQKHTGTGPRKAVSPSRTLDESPEAVARALWEEATRDAQAWKARPYDPHRSYLPDDLIAHKVHGLGVVREALEGAILVLFREGFQRLPHDVPQDDES